MEPIKVIIPKTKKDLEELEKLDKEGKLVSGGSYPTKEQMDKITPEETEK